MSTSIFYKFTSQPLGCIAAAHSAFTTSHTQMSPVIHHGRTPITPLNGSKNSWWILGRDHTVYTVISVYTHTPHVVLYESIFTHKFTSVN